MRKTSLLLVFLAFAVCRAADDTTLSALAQLASALSQNDAVSAMQVFDPAMKDYGAIEGSVSALVAQNDVLCAIDVVDEKEAGDVHTLDADWYMQLKSQAAAGPVERRRERVVLQMKKIRGKWKITSLSPLSIFTPVTIR